MKTDNRKTPYFLIREEILKENVEGFRTALREDWGAFVLSYSVKTNTLPWIVRWMNEHDVFAEVVSDMEYDVAMMSGHAGSHLVFNGPVKGEERFLKAVADGAFVNVDSAKELELIRARHPKISGNLGLRVNVPATLFKSEDVGYQEDGFRFGYAEENGEFKRALEALTEVYGHKQFGLHMHVNSVTRAVDVYRTIAKYARDLIRKYGIDPTYIDVGGGFFGGVPGKATPHEYISAIREELESVVDTKKTKLIIEPGSALIGSAVDLHTSVLDVKDTSLGRIVTTDGSRIYTDPLWAKSRYMYTTDSGKDVFPRQVICGYTCMDHDRIMVLENAPELAVGDHIVYHRVGNYTTTLGAPFILPFPAVYAQCGEDIVTARKRMSHEQFFEMESGEK